MFFFHSLSLFGCMLENCKNQKYVFIKSIAWKSSFRKRKFSFYEFVEKHTGWTQPKEWKIEFNGDSVSSRCQSIQHSYTQTSLSIDAEICFKNVAHFWVRYIQVKWVRTTISAKRNENESIKTDYENWKIKDSCEKVC